MKIAKKIAEQLEPVKDALESVTIDADGLSVIMPLRAHADWLLTVENHSEKSLMAVAAWFNELADNIEKQEAVLALFKDE